MVPLGSNVHNSVKAMIAAQGWTLTRVVEKMNELRTEDNQTSVQNISNKLTRGTIKYVEVAEIAKIIGINLFWDSVTREVAENGKLR